MSVKLKHPLSSYGPRFDRFLRLMVNVRGLKPIDVQMWKIMDSASFEDTETAMQIVLIESNEVTHIDPALLGHRAND